MKHFNLIKFEPPRGWIEVTTFSDHCRVFLEPCYIETSPSGDPVDYRRVEVPFVPQPTLWQKIQQLVRESW